MLYASYDDQDCRVVVMEQSTKMNTMQEDFHEHHQALVMTGLAVSMESTAESLHVRYIYVPPSATQSVLGGALICVKDFFQTGLHPANLSSL